MGQIEAGEGAAAERALVDEAMKKSGLIWVGPGRDGRSRAYWHAWLDGRAYLLTGPDEQPDPDLPGDAEVKVVVRSKDNAQRLVAFAATAARVGVTDDDWDAATSALAAGRLNLDDPQQAPARWGSDPATVIYRLTPVGALVERPGAYDDGSGRAAPVPSPATTAGRAPWVLHRRGGSGRDLS